MNQIGAPELVIVLTLAVFWLLPAAAAVWALVTLHRLRRGQEEMNRTLQSIERLLQRPERGGT